MTCLGLMFRLYNVIYKSPQSKPGSAIDTLIKIGVPDGYSFCKETMFIPSLLVMTVFPPRFYYFETIFHEIDF